MNDNIREFFDGMQLQLALLSGNIDGMRRLVKDGEVTPDTALFWLRKVDPSPNPRAVAWLERRIRNG